MSTERLDSGRRQGRRIARRQGAENSIRGLVGTRFLGLPEAARGIVGCAALLGYRFEVPLLASSLGGAVHQVLPALRRAQSLDLVVADREVTQGYRFRHDLTRTAIRQQLEPKQRSAFHAGIAAALESLPDAAIRSRQIAGHWVSAGNPQRAVFHLERAAREARLLGLEG